MTEDDYFDMQELMVPVSNCCGAILDDSSDYCPECRSGCVSITLREYQTEEYENAMEDRHEAMKELKENL